MSDVVLRGNWAAAHTLISKAVDALAATGIDIAERAQELMVPGHFYDTGLSEENTAYEQVTPTSGQVHIPTDYAAYPEFGTATMAPRPVLGPAIEGCWPEKLLEHWEEARLGTLPHQSLRHGRGARAPISRPTGGGTP